MVTNSKIVIHWFRQDLRVSDNPALSAANEQGQVLPIYILDETNCSDCSMGAASRWWLHQSLKKLNENLGGTLNIYHGDPKQILPRLVELHSVKGVYWNRCYEPWRMDRDKEIKALLACDDISTNSFNGSLLWEPWEIQKADGSPYKVFTPFFRRGCLNKAPPRIPLSRPKGLLPVKDEKNSLSIDDLGLLPKSGSAEKIAECWNVGEKEAQKKIDRLITKSVSDYKSGRNYPAQDAVSRLSPHLHFGEVSPNQVWHSLSQLPENDNIDCFKSELGWREFSYSQLYYFHDLPNSNLQSKFDHFPWQDNSEHLKAWQRGQTGYPLVDAGMRELWQTGYMHNRVRMVVGSFLVKNLLIHWRQGAEWFWDCLVDADLASNSGSWQWVAGSGADAAPFFRIFNPVTQGEKYDPQGEYTRRFVPELSNLPDKFIHKPFAAPKEILEKAGVSLGGTYPLPIVDIKTSRERALTAYKSIK